MQHMEILNEVFLALAGFVGGLIVADDDDRKGEIFSYYSYLTLPFSDREYSDHRNCIS